MNSVVADEFFEADARSGRRRRRRRRYFLRNGYAASRDRVTIFHSSVADSIHPYNHSSSPIYGNWQHVMEPLIELDYNKKDYVGVLADSWQFQGNKWTFKLKKGIKFHNGAPLDLERRGIFDRENAR